MYKIVDIKIAKNGKFLKISKLYKSVNKLYFIQKKLSIFFIIFLFIMNFESVKIENRVFSQGKRT